MKKIFNKTIILVLSLIITLWFSNWESIYQSNKNFDSFDVTNASETIKNLEKSIEDITSQLYELDNKEIWNQWDISKKYREIRSEIVSVIQDINYTTNYVWSMLEKVAKYKKQIFLNTKQLKDTRAWLETTKELISKFSNFLYKINNEFWDWDKLDEFKLFAKSDNIPLTLSNEYIIKAILSQFNDLLTNLDINEEKQIKIIKTLNELKIKANKDILEYQVILDTLHQKKNYLIEFIKLYKDDNLIEQNFSMIFNNRKDVHNTITSMISNIYKKEYKDISFDMEEKLEELDIINQENENMKIQPMARPIYPIEEIENYFWDENFEKEYWIPNRWVQVKANQWTPVYSSNDGIVYHVTNNPWIWINWMLILHKNWYISAYMFLNSSVVKEWEVVRRWQLLWYSWWEPWTKWAWFISKWSNLTFFIFKDWIVIDPLQLLDLSVIKNKEIIPNEYNIKYLNDKYARNIDVSDLKFMSWDNTMERSDNFLQTYGVWIYREIAFREDAVKDTNIDRDVVICIAFAESTLWRYLTTSNNIWNVWNDDSWNRISMVSALAWARAIANTLNNQHLWEYHTIKQLSRYGNKDWKIYASSSINRQKNVTNCLSQIKWFYVPEDYPFRTGENPRINEILEKQEQ